MNPAVADIVMMVDDIVSAVGKDNVAKEMELHYGWRKINPDNIPGDIESYFIHDVDEDDFDDLLELTYDEFYNIAFKFNHSISTFD